MTSALALSYQIDAHGPIATHTRPNDAIALHGHTVQPVGPTPVANEYVNKERPEREVDIECYRNYFLVKFRDKATGMTTSFPMYPGKDLDVLGVMDFVRSYTLVSFNGNKYDIPMLTLALSGVSNTALKDASDTIIQNGLQPWEFYQAYKVSPPYELDHIDLFEVAPGVGISLKMYAGRQHSKQMQDLPIEPSALIDALQRVQLDVYCGNDLEVTADLKDEVTERIDLRKALSAQYHVDVRSKSDAQIAEAVIKSKLSFRPDKRYVEHGFAFHYKAPNYVQFQTPELQRVLQTILSTPFVVEDKAQARWIHGETDDGDVYGPDGKKIGTGVRLPADIRNMQIKIGNTAYQMGIGGLHSQESATVHYTVKNAYIMSDHDVTSYYPSLILLLGMFPEQLTREFLEIYRAIYDRRLFCKAEAKRLARLLDEPLNQVEALFEGLKASVAKAKTEADGLKIVLNGTFGKLLSKYSILFAPELGIQVTVTGQLSLFMLIEALELAGISVVSANTDGIVVRCPYHLTAIRDQIIKDWEKRTGLETEATFYSAIYSRDVNNYLAFKMDGVFNGKKVEGKGHKGKGIYAESGVLNNKHPQADISQEAVIKYLTDGTPIEQTVRTVNDARKLLVIRAVRGGGWYQPKAYPELDRMKHTVKNLLARHAKAVQDYNTAKRVELVDKINELQIAINEQEAAKNAERRYLGKAVRWYYSTQREGHVVTNKGHLVGTSEGAMPAMRLPESLPADVDYQWYINHAHDMLTDLGLRVHYNRSHY